ncbi:MAG: hypothetical protein R3A46_00710 [Thermomicrobiales bacterium]
MADVNSIETYRSLRATIKHAAGEARVRSVLIVDVDRKTPSGVARNTALAFAAAQERCALVDTNFRGRHVDGLGLADMMKDPSVEVDFGPDDDGLVVVPAGSSGDPDMLSSDRFTQTLDAIIEKFDYTIVTCDVYPGSGDAIAIAPVVDAVIIVISAGVTGREPAIQARDALERVGARILGLVMIERPKRWF